MDVVLCANSWLHAVVSIGLFVCTYYSLTQLQILKKYWVNWEWNQASTEDFHFGRRLFSKRRVCGELPEVQGQDWKVTLVGSEVSQI